MIAEVDVGVAAIVAASVTGTLALVGTIIAAIYARRASKHSATTNGQMQGVLVEQIAAKQEEQSDKLDLVLLWVKEHVRYHDPTP